MKIPTSFVLSTYMKYYRTCSPPTRRSYRVRHTYFYMFCLKIMLLREFAVSEFHSEKVLHTKYISSYSKYTNGYIEFFSRTCLGTYSHLHSIFLCYNSSRNILVLSFVASHFVRYLILVRKKIQDG